jgi:hypothetical protein
MASVASSDESAPPDPAPQNIAAAALNPVWAQAAAGGYNHGTGRGRGGRAGGRGAAGSNGSDHGDEAHALGPISLVELEHRHRLTADGAESSMFSDDEEERAERDETTRRPGKRRRRDEDASEEESEAAAPRQKRATGTDTAAAMAAAAFGSGAPIVDDADGDSEMESSATGGALVPFKRTFPVRGVTCVGCAAEREIVAKVDDFVKKNCVKMQEDALYRTAAVFWRTTVVEPARREGVAIAEWAWKDIRSHYQLHVCDPFIQRFDCCRQLASVRKMLELSLVRREGENRVVDHKNTDLLLKVIGMQSRELTLLTSGSMPPPPNRPANRPPGDVAAK